MSDPIAMWHADHADYSRLLDVLEEQLLTCHVGRDPDYRLMLDVVSYLRHFPDRIHHAREDAAFARLVERNPALQRPIDLLRQEHRVIAAAGDNLLKLLSRAVEGALIGHAALEAAADAYLVYYRHHLAHEEREILPLAARLLSADDWRIVASAVASTPDPLFAEGFAERYRALRERIAARSSVA
jgi:hemerythrin-like domain-containing protein